MISMHKYIHGRQLRVDVHTVWIDHEDRCITTPMWNLSGQITGYIRHRPDAPKSTASNNPLEGRYFTRSRRKDIVAWGVETWDFSDTLFITEGIFDASRITWRGYSALAMSSSDINAATKNWLWTIRQSRRIVAVCDNDSHGAGLKLGKYAHETVVVPGGNGADLGDMPDSYVNDLLLEYN